MKADLSRGHRPDEKRGKSYRRVLLQQGRLLLDSDLAAMTDAIDAGMRVLSRDTAGDAGSRDHGFLVTPGMPLAIFDSLDAVTSAPGSTPEFSYFIDHGTRYPDLDPANALYESLHLSRRYLGRLPALFISSEKGQGAVTVTLLNAIRAQDKVRIWARVPLQAALQVQLAGAANAELLPGKGTDRFYAYDFDASNDCTSLNLWVKSAIAVKEIWVALIEKHQPAGSEPSFWIKKGRYHIGGVAIELPADGSFPAVSFPGIEGAGFSHPSAPGSNLFVAYVECWERLITGIEDPGILERALGGAVDTCARTRAMGQIKLTAFPSGFHAAQVPSLFRRLHTAKGMLEIQAQSQATVDDPCEIPDAEGYIGGENRLYRFEVHAGGSFDDFEIKWSRNNGADLYHATHAQSNPAQLELSPGADLHDGDLVELLSEKIDLDDVAAGQLDAAGFRPPRRAVGQLYLVRELAAPGRIELTGTDGVQVDLTGDPVVSQAGLKLRRWHGLLKAQDVANSGSCRLYLVDGLEVAIKFSGGNAADTTLFRPGDYWQYEARAVQRNDNGPWNPYPLGPERLFAPLALLKRAAPDEPLEVLQWYGGHFAPLGALDADHVPYDNTKVGSPSQTVQQALDELFARHDDGCCYVDLEPVENPTDDAQRIQGLLEDKLKKGGVICLRPGVYYLRSQISVTDKRLDLRGCPDAVLVAETSQTPFVVHNHSSLALSEVVLCTSKNGTPPPSLIDLDGDASLSVEECGLFHLGPGTGSGNPGIAVRTAAAQPTIFSMNGTTYAPAYPLPDQPTTTQAPRIRVDESVIIARYAVAAGSLESLAMRGTLCRCRDGVVHVVNELVGMSLSDCALATDLPDSAFDSFRNTEPSQVAETVRAFLESTTLPSQPAGTAFYALEVFGGSISKTAFFGRLAFCAQLARKLLLQGNTYTGRNGIRLDNVVESMLEGERVDVQSAVQEHPTGIVVARSAIELTIAGCSIHATSAISDAWGAGILLATRKVYPDSTPRRFQGVSVEENHIRATGVAIQIRSADDTDSASGLPDHIRIHGNNIEQNGQIGISCPKTQQMPAAGRSCITLSANSIRMSPAHDGWHYYYNIFSGRDSVIITDNHIALRGAEAGSRWGILLSKADDNRVAGNVIDMDGDDQYDTPFAAGIYVADSHRVTVADNVLRATGNARSIEGRRSKALTIEGNDLGSSYKGVYLLQCDDCVVRDNTASCNIQIRMDCKDSELHQGTRGGIGALSANHLRYSTAIEAIDATTNWNTASPTGPHIFVDIVVENTGSQGSPPYVPGTSWMVMNNVTPGQIVVRPRSMTKQQVPVSSFAEPLYMAKIAGNYANAIIAGWCELPFPSLKPSNAMSRLLLTGNIARAWILTNGYLKMALTSNLAPYVYYYGSENVATMENRIDNNTPG